MTLKTLEIYSLLESKNTLKVFAEYETFTGSVSISSYLNERLVNRVSVPYESIKSIVTTIEAMKFNKELQQ
jgi:hypothetical protein